MRIYIYFQRLLFEVLYAYERLKYEWVEVGKTYHRIDPVSPPDEVFNPLMEHYTQVIGKGENDHILFKFLSKLIFRFQFLLKKSKLTEKIGIY